MAKIYMKPMSLERKTVQTLSCCEEGLTVAVDIAAPSSAIIALSKTAHAGGRGLTGLASYIQLGECSVSLFKNSD